MTISSNEKIHIVFGEDDFDFLLSELQEMLNENSVLSAFASGILGNLKRDAVHHRKSSVACPENSVSVEMYGDNAAYLMIILLNRLQKCRNNG